MTDVDKLLALSPEGDELIRRAEEVAARLNRNPNDQYALDLAAQLQADALKFFTKLESLKG